MAALAGRAGLGGWQDGRRGGTSLGLAVLVHAVLLLLGVLLARHAVHEATQDEAEPIMTFAPPPPPPPPPPSGGGARSASARPKPIPRPDPVPVVEPTPTIIETVETPVEPDPEPASRDAVMEEAAGGVDGGVPGGVPGGVLGGVVGGTVGGVPGGVLGGALGGTADDPMKITAMVTPPVALSKPPPDYPPLARRMRIEGEVIIEAIIGRDGRVKVHRVVRPVEHLTEAAIAAVERWTYKPALFEGHPQAVYLVVRVQFRQ